jgi:hypothetical protein
VLTVETPIRFKVVNMRLEGDGVAVLMHGFVDEEPKTDAAFKGHPTASSINLVLRPDVAAQFKVGTVHTVKFQ